MTGSNEERKEDVLFVQGGKPGSRSIVAIFDPTTLKRTHKKDFLFAMSVVLRKLVLVHKQARLVIKGCKAEPLLEKSPSKEI